MADERLRQLRRDWDQGDLDTRVRLLRERLRAGELSEARVRLAAFLGAESAAFATEFDHVAPLVPLVAAEEIVRGTWSDHESRVRLAVASARAVLPGWLQAYPRDPQVPDALDALEAFLCGEAAEAPLSAPVHEAVRRQRLAAPAGDLWRSVGVGSPTAFAIESTQQVDPPLHEDGALLAFRRAADGMEWLRGPDTRPGQFRLLDAVSRELVPWALGLRDPVAERVAARGAT